MIWRKDLPGQGTTSANEEEHGFFKDKQGGQHAGILVEGWGRLGNEIGKEEMIGGMNE